MDQEMHEICVHERLGMLTRHVYGYDQHDDHVWRWLNYRLWQWGLKHPIRVRS